MALDFKARYAPSDPVWITDRVFLFVGIEVLERPLVGRIVRFGIRRLIGSAARDVLRRGFWEYRMNHVPSFFQIEGREMD